MTNLDPGPFNIWKVEKHDQPDFWKAVIAVCLLLGLLLHSCFSEAQTPQNPGMSFLCSETHRSLGLRSNDPEVLLGAVLVYLGKIEPEIFLRMIKKKDDRRVAAKWLKSCLGIDVKDLI